MVEAAGRGELDVLWSSGGNFLDTLPDPAAVEAALARVPLRVHVDIVVSAQMLVDPGEEVLLLPAMTRYEQPGGGTETTTERRVAFSPEIPGPRIGEARAEWQIFGDLARRVDPERRGAPRLRGRPGHPRRDRPRACRSTTASSTWPRPATRSSGAASACATTGASRRPTARPTSGVVTPREAGLPDGRFLLSTRRGKQFNSMVRKQRDPLTGADRDALFMADADLRALGLRDGTPVVVRSDRAEVRARVRPAKLRRGNVQMFFPEANPLIAPGRLDPVGAGPRLQRGGRGHPRRNSLTVQRMRA